VSRDEIEMAIFGHGREPDRGRAGRRRRR